MSLTPRSDRRDKNYLANGSFRLYQRAQSAVTVAGVGDFYAPDRWNNTTLNQDFTVKKSSDVPSISKSENSLEYTTVSPIGGTDRVLWIDQKIEALHARELANESISFRLDCKSVSANKLRIVFYSADGLDDFSTVTTIHEVLLDITNDSTWQEVKIENLALPDVSNGLMVGFGFENTVNLVPGSHFFADVKLSIGETAQEFSYFNGSQKEDEIYCKRFYQKSYLLDVDPGSYPDVRGAIYYQGASSTTSALTLSFQFIEMRIIPVMQLYNPVDGTNSLYLVGTGTAGSGVFNDISPHSAHMSLTAGHSASVGFSGHWTADAEF